MPSTPLDEPLCPNADLDLEAGLGADRDPLLHPARVSYGMKQLSPSAYDPRECRICLDSDKPGDFIAPCLCSGTGKWIHRKCLDQWRATRHSSRALTNCMECGFEYRLELKEKWDDTQAVHKICCCNVGRRSKFRSLIMRDFVCVFLLLQLWLCSLGVLIRLCDPNENVVTWLHLNQEEGQDESKGVLNALRHHKTTYWLAALLVSLALIGLVTCMMYCCSSSEGRDRMMGRQTSQNYRAAGSGGGNGNCCCCCCDGSYSGGGPTYVYCGDCNCGDGCCDCGGNCDCGNDGDCGEAGAILLFIAVAIFVILVFVGLIAGIFIGILIVQRIVQRHVHVLNRKLLAREFIVLDLSGYDMKTYRAGGFPAYVQQSPASSKQPAPTAPPFEAPVPSAPPLPPPSEANFEANRRMQGELEYYGY